VIYFDNAATSFPKPPGVIEAVVRAMHEFGNPARGAHDFAMAALRRVEETRTAAAALFGFASPSRVAFCKNATEALNIVIGSVDGHIVTTEAEHNSVLRPLHRRGNFSIVPVDALGRCTAADIAAHCRPDTAAVVVAHASNVTGNVAPLDAVARVCRERGILLVVDAAQTAGLLAIDMDRTGIDALCFTGHKSLFGPQGTGGVCVGERLAVRPLLVGGSGSRSFDLDQPPHLPDLLEAGTMNAHGLAGLAAGMDYIAATGRETIFAAARRLASLFLDGLADIRGVTLYGDYGAAERVPIVTLNVGDVDSAEVADALARDYGIAVRAGAHCAPLLHRRFGTEGRGAVRFSFSHSNTEEEVRHALRALAEIIQ
jgi:cysteine desulfurase family protein